MLVWSRRFLVRKEEFCFVNNNLDCRCCCCSLKICVNAFGPSTIMQGKATEVSTKYRSLKKYQNQRIAHPSYFKNLKRTHGFS
jgi:hypothetical protein